MLGRKNGVAKMLLDKFPKLFIWHCVAHRLELAVHDSIKEITGINHFKTFLDKLYVLYHQSPKNQEELKHCALSLDVVLLSIGKMLDTRWVASSFRTVKAVWQNYTALHQHFQKASADSTRSSVERQKYSGLATRLTTHEFVKNLGTMYDALGLQELSELSLKLQQRDIFLHDAHEAVSICIAVLEKFAENSENPSEKSATSVAKAAVNLEKFKDIQISPGRKCDVLINTAQFFRSLANNLKQRLFSFRSSHVSTTADTEAVYANFMKQVEVLFPCNWPQVVDITYGDDAVDSLAEQLNLPRRPAVIAFRRYKASKGTILKKELLDVITMLKMIPVCTAECERGFSQMNLILRTQRNCLAIPTLSSLMYCKLVGPPLQKFDPTRYLQKWLAKGHHTANDRNSKVAKPQEFSTQFVSVWELL